MINTVTLTDKQQASIKSYVRHYRRLRPAGKEPAGGLATWLRDKGLLGDEVAYGIGVYLAGWDKEE